MIQTTLIRDADVDVLADGVLTTLESVGVLCQNERMLDALGAAGARVDRVNQTATFPREMTCEYVDSFRAQYACEKRPQHYRDPGLPGLTTQIAQFYHDFDRRERRSGTTRELVEMAKLGEVLHGGGGVGHSLLLTDVPPMVEPLAAAMVLAEYATRPRGVFAWNVRHGPYLEEMGDILGVPDLHTWGSICIAHPFRFDRDVADRMERMIRAGQSIGLTAMPVAGVTTPVTVEGFVVVSSAELVAAWIMARALEPTVPVNGGSMWAGTVDMRTGHVSFSAPDAMFYAFASVEFVRRWCGIDLPVGGGEYSDAREPGLYAALEKVYKAMTIAAFGGRSTGIGEGMLDEGKVLSPVQLLLERDMSASIAHLSRDLAPSAESIALQEILEVGAGVGASHVQTEHTLRHHRASLWRPRLMDRSGWAGADAEEEILRTTNAQVKDLIAGYRKPEGREDQLARMREVVDRARRDLL